MAQQLDAAPIPVPVRRRPRGRRMAFVTLAMAGTYLWGTDVALNGGDRWSLNWDGLRRTNSARAIMIAFAPRPSATPGQPRAGLGGLLPPASVPRPGGAAAVSDEVANQDAAYRRHLREVGAVEGVAYLWERAMWGLCGFLVAVALLSWITPWGRGWHLLAAIAIVLVGLLSLACLRYLEIPDGQGQAIWPLTPAWQEALTRAWNLPEGGGLPPLLPRTYLALGTIISGYGWLLVVVFARPTRATAAARPSLYNE